MVNAIAIIVIVLLVVIAFLMSRYLMQRSIRTVVKIFRQTGAVSAKNAKTLADLGLAPKPLMQRVFRPRDYKPQALRLLDQEGCIKLADAGRVWLDVEALRQSRLGQFAKID